MSSGLFAPGEGDKAPSVFLSYQANWVKDQSQVKFCEKSRRIGITWAEAADDVLLSATEGKKGMDTLYIGYNQEMTREYIDTCAEWARKFNKVCSEVQEFMFEDEDPDREIRAFRISFASGHEIVALSSRPTNLRGRQGRVVIDEAAFHEDLKGLLKAALALLIWGGQVVVVSTHFSEDNDFNQYVQDIRAKRLDYSLHRYDFDLALAAGLYKRICYVRGIEWSEAEEKIWRQKVINFYGDDADEELFCIPSKGGGLYLLRNIIEACMDPTIPVLRWQPPAKDFVDWRDDQRFREVRAWCDGELAPVLNNLSKAAAWLGEDFGRNVDLSAIWPLQETPGLTYRTPFLLELSDCPFAQQEQIFCFIADRLGRFAGGALDKGGNGAFLAERARQHYGQHRIEEVHFSDTWNLGNWPPARAALEDRTVTIPKDNQVLEDFRAVKKVKGVPKVPRDARTENKTGNKRHGDTAIGYVLSMFAARKLESAGPVEVTHGKKLESTKMAAGY
jgi:phage FluMu gp28-like protein